MTQTNITLDEVRIIGIRNKYTFSYLEDGIWVEHPDYWRSFEETARAAQSFFETRKAEQFIADAVAKLR